MSLAKRLPLILSLSNVMLFFITVHVAIFVFSTWEAFIWFNNWIVIADWSKFPIVTSTYEDPVVTAWSFWIAESLIVLFLLKRKIRASHYAP